MEIKWDTKLYCLIGKPIDSSLSPKIHNNIFQRLNENSVYLAFNIEEDQLEKAIKGLKSMNVSGFNVTIPYKKAIMKYLDDISPDAKRADAVNTVKNHNSKLIGHNTDGVGFLKAFRDENMDLENKNILLLGAGGASYGIACVLAMENIQKLYIANRTIEKSLILEKHINKINKKIKIEPMNLNIESLNKESIDIIINTTSVGMYPMENLSPLALDGFTKNTVVYDIIYKPYETKLIKDATMRGLKTFNGMPMLLNQAIYSQSIWLDIDEKKIFEKIIKKEGLLA